MNELETRLYALLARPMRAEELKKDIRPPIPSSRSDRHSTS